MPRFTNMTIGTVLASGMRYADEDLTLRELLSYEVRSPLSFKGFNADKDGRYTFRADCFPSMHWSRQREYPWALYLGDVCNHHRVLDVGAGTSVFQLALAKRSRTVVTVDTDTDNVKAMAELSDLCLVPYSQPVRGDVRRLPFADGSFDRVFCLSVLEHMRDGHRTALNELSRVVKPGGKLILTFDVTVSGGRQGADFFVDEPAALGMLAYLGADEVPRLEYSLMRYDDVGKDIYTMMVCCVA